MKIGVVGCGALGSYYGAKLCRDGQEVHFLLRSDYDVVRRHGVTVHSPEGDFNARPRCARTPEEIGVCDLVIIGLKTTANHQFPKLLPPLVGPQTAVLTLQNGLGNEAQLEALFGNERVLGGLCHVCLNRTAPGQIHHLAHGKIVMGEYLRWPEPRTHDIASAIRHAGVPCKVTDDLENAHWEKLVWNIPFNGLGVAGTVGYDAFLRGEVVTKDLRTPCLSTADLLGDSNWCGLVETLMHEVIAAANALGHKLSPEQAAYELKRTREMGAYRASTLIDYEQGQPLELDSLFLEPLRRAQTAQVATPLMATLGRVLSGLDATR